MHFKLPVVRTVTIFFVQSTHITFYPSLITMNDGENNNNDGVQKDKKNLRQEGAASDGQDAIPEYTVSSLTASQGDFGTTRHKSGTTMPPPGHNSASLLLNNEIQEQGSISHIMRSFDSFSKFKFQMRNLFV